MELLEAGRSGQLRGHTVAPTLRPVLIEAGLRLIALCGDAHRAGDDPWLNLVTRETRIFDGAETHAAQLETRGAFGTRLPWQQDFGTLLALLADARDAAEAVSAPLARALNEILLKLNLQWYAVDALRADDDVLAFAGVMAKIGQSAREGMLRDGFPPAYLVARGLCLAKLTDPATEGSADSWAEAAYGLQDEGDVAAARARRARDYTGVVTASLEALLSYEGAVHLYLSFAIPGRQQETGQKPDDLIRDWGVCEEFRVGALEVVRSFGRSLLWRPAHFLRGGIGQPLREAMRRALLTARGQISVYPDSMTPLWESAVDVIGQDIRVTDDNWFELSGRLEDLAADRLTAAFEDRDVAAVAERLRNARRGRSRLYLRPDWPRSVFWDREAMITEEPAPLPPDAPRNFSVKTDSHYERAFMKTVLGLPDWPFRPKR